MPYSISREKSGLLTKWWGSASNSELIQMQQYLHAHPDFELLRYSLHDLSECDYFAWSHDEAAVSSALDGAASRTNPRLKIAIVGANSEVLKSIDAYMNIGLSPYPLRIFAFMDEARVWVMET